ncbi:MAG: DNA-directed RNA polymerase sigma-70 factor [Cyclobacteriaceae bacterium]|nr:MAG: DNA-directed RNA polymerase sigma-70 factor [Cyclobacteriaceae bacterium]
MHNLIEGCKRNDRRCQRQLYNAYYGYCFSVCARYCRTSEEAREVTNDGFMKIFQKIDQYKPDTSFKAWIRRIMINASIDHYRKEKKHYYQQTADLVLHKLIVPPDAVNELSHKELIALVQSLPPAYRMVFNLYAIDGYTHEEIGAILGISAGTSKSNLSKAREQLRRMLEMINKRKYAKLA